MAAAVAGTIVHAFSNADAFIAPHSTARSVLSPLPTRAYTASPACTHLHSLWPYACAVGQPSQSGSHTFSAIARCKHTSRPTGCSAYLTIHSGNVEGQQQPVMQSLAAPSYTQWRGTLLLLARRHWRAGPESELHRPTRVTGGCIGCAGRCNVRPDRRSSRRAFLSRLRCIDVGGGRHRELRHAILTRRQRPGRRAVGRGAREGEAS